LVVGGLFIKIRWLGELRIDSPALARRAFW
jgi:hypothetical protein